MIMTIPRKFWIVALLGLSSGLLSVLIPGGPIETRRFSHINPLILGGFNTFLTSLVLVSLLLLCVVAQGRAWALLASAFCGVFYFLVYVLDLGTLFPISPDPMPQALWGIEVLGAIVSIPLMWLAAQGFLSHLHYTGDVVENKTYPKFFVYFAFLSVMLGLGIITFATQAAIGS